MAQFYGSVHGSRGEATRLGGKGSGMRVLAASWQGAIRTVLWHNEELGVDCYRVEQTGWHGVGVSKILAEGVVGK
jgi:hypothetical protein